MPDLYVPSPLVEIYHSFPRITLDFVSDDSQSSLYSSTYLTGLMFTGFLPIAALILSIVGFIIFYNWVKCEAANQKEESYASCYCSQYLIVFAMFITLSGVGAAVYGSVEVKNGIHYATKTIKAMASVHHSLPDIVLIVNKSSSLANNMQETSNQLLKIFPNDEDVENIIKMSDNLTQTFLEFPTQNKSSSKHFTFLKDFIVNSEYYRSTITYSLVGAIGLVCLSALLGIIFHSKYCLMWTILAGHTCLVLSYLYLTILFVFGLALSDLCVDPYTFIENEIIGKIFQNETVSYYMKCWMDLNVEVPYSREIDEVNKQLNGINAVLNQTAKFNAQTDNGLSNEMRSRSKSLEINSAYFEQFAKCKDLHEPNLLDDFVTAWCFFIFDGLFVGLAAAMCVCFALTVMLAAVPYAWRRYSQEENDEAEEDWNYMDPMRSSWQENSRSDGRYSVSHHPRTRTMKVSRRGQDVDHRWAAEPPPYSL